MSERDLHFNDLRGTAATKFYIAGFIMREIAETLAWEKEPVEDTSGGTPPSRHVSGSWKPESEQIRQNRLADSG